MLDHRADLPAMGQHARDLALALDPHRYAGRLIEAAALATGRGPGSGGLAPPT
jgi:hypothetical protein